MTGSPVRLPQRDHPAKPSSSRRGRTAAGFPDACHQRQDSHAASGRSPAQPLPVADLAIRLLPRQQLPMNRTSTIPANARKLDAGAAGSGAGGPSVAALCTLPPCGRSRGPHSPKRTPDRSENQAAGPAAAPDHRRAATPALSEITRCRARHDEDCADSRFPDAPRAGPASTLILPDPPHSREEVCRPDQVTR
jgi:hypothetical protein